MPSSGVPPAGFVAALGDLPADVGGSAIWPDLPGLRVYGAWRPAELVTVTHPVGRLLVLGHGLPSPETVARDFGATLGAGGLYQADFDRLTRWSGAYTLVIALPGEFIAYTDLAGQFPIYCSTSAGRTVLSSHAGVVARLHNRLPDHLTAAARIACPDVLPLWANRSAYQDVHRLGGGMTIRVRPGSPFTRSYESPIRPLGPEALVALTTSAAPSRVAGPADSRSPAGAAGATASGVTASGVTASGVAASGGSTGVARVRAALLAAVDVRRAGGDRLGADLSGGLDSTSLAFLAVREESAPMLRAVTYAHPDLPVADLAEATAFARLSSRIHQEIVRGDEGTLPYQDLVAGEFGHSEPAPTVISWRRAALRFAHAAEQGVTVHLTGEGGDALFGAPPSHLAELARRRALARLVRHCVTYARSRHESPARLAGRAMATAFTSPGTALRRLAELISDQEISAGTLLRPDAEAVSDRASAAPLGWGDAVTWWPVWPEALGWLRAETRAALAEAVGEPSLARAVPEGFSAFDLATLTELRASAETQGFMRELGQRHGVAVHAPYLDSEVVRACLGASVFDRVDASSAKPLLAAALGALVPAQVLARQGKGDYSGEDFRGARRAAAELAALFTGSRLAAAGVIDESAVQRSLHRLRAGVAIPMGPFNRMVATEIWLRRVAAGVAAP